MPARLKPVVTPGSIVADVQIAVGYTASIPSATSIAAGLLSKDQITLNSGGPPASGAIMLFDTDFRWSAKSASFRSDEVGSDVRLTEDGNIRTTES